MLQLTKGHPGAWQAWSTPQQPPLFMPAASVDVGSHGVGAPAARRLVGPGGRCEIFRRDLREKSHVRAYAEPAIYGLVPTWAYDSRCATQNCVAPMRSVINKPAYRAAFRKAQFCWTSAAYFIGSVWREGREEIVRVERADLSPLFLAGLWSEWQVDGGEPLLSFSLFTRDHGSDLKSQTIRVGYGMSQCYALLEPSQLVEWLDQSFETAFDFLHRSPIPSFRLDSPPGAF